MGSIGRKPITSRISMKIGIAVLVAAVLTMLAALMLSGGGGPTAGKPLLLGAILAIPLVVAAKYGWTTGPSMVLAFVTYFAVCFLVVLFFTREKRATQSE